MVCLLRIADCKNISEDVQEAITRQMKVFSTVGMHFCPPGTPFR